MGAVWLGIGTTYHVIVARRRAQEMMKGEVPVGMDITPPEGRQTQLKPVPTPES